MAEDALSLVGCVILTDPVFFSDDEQFEQPADWRGPIVTGKRYSDDNGIGQEIWEKVRVRLQARQFYAREDSSVDQSVFAITDERYRETMLKVRLGQGAFRIMVTSAYANACAITGDHTLPVLEAAHIKPFSLSGPHAVANGILMRSDLHKLFDDGYMTITPDYRVEVSPSIREEFNNGKEYYAMHGRNLLVPSRFSEKPNAEFLRWHNENIYKAG